MPRTKNKRMPNGYGSKPFLRKDGRYQINITLPTGKRKTINANTLEEVTKAARAIAADIDEGQYINPERMKLSKWIELWLKNYCGHLKPETARKYASDCKLHIIPELGRMNLSDIHPVHIQSFVNSLEMSPHSIHNIHGTLSKCFSEAVRVGLIRSNPCSLTKLPKGRRPEITPLQGKEITDFLAAIKDTDDYQLFYTALWTGMRLSELLGLQWKCVNFKNGTIRVKQQLSWNRGNGRELTTPKNHKERTIMPPSSVMDALLREKVIQNQRQLKAGSGWSNPLDLVFTDTIGEPLVHGTIEKRIQRIYNQIGVKDRVFHDLRHTFATESLRLGTPIKTVSEMLGHASVAFTMDVYAGYTPVMQQDSSNRLQAEIERIRDA